MPIPKWQQSNAGSAVQGGALSRGALDSYSGQEWPDPGHAPVGRAHLQAQSIPCCPEPAGRKRGRQRGLGKSGHIHTQADARISFDFTTVSRSAPRVCHYVPRTCACTRVTGNPSLEVDLNRDYVHVREFLMADRVQQGATAPHRMHVGAPDNRQSLSRMTPMKLCWRRP